MMLWIILSIILCILFGVVGFVLGYKRCAKFAGNRIEVLQRTAESASVRANYLNFFWKLKDNNISIASFFSQNNIGKIAIYGYGVVGKRLEQELENSDVQIMFAVDQNAEKKVASIPIYSIKDNLPSYEILVVTTGNADEIRAMIGGNRDTVIELLDIIQMVSKVDMEKLC